MDTQAILRNILREEILESRDNGVEALDESSLPLSGETLFRMLIRYSFIKKINTESSLKFFHEVLGLYRKKVQSILDVRKGIKSADLANLYNIDYDVDLDQNIQLKYRPNPSKDRFLFESTDIERIAEIIERVNGIIRSRDNPIEEIIPTIPESMTGNIPSSSDSITQEKPKRPKLFFGDSKKMTREELEEYDAAENLKKDMEKVSGGAKTEEGIREDEEPDSQAPPPSNPQTRGLSTEMLSEMLEKSRNADVFYITTAQASKRDAIQDTWLHRWGNPCFCLRDAALPYYTDVFSKQTPKLKNEIIFAGLLVLIRNFTNEKHAAAPFGEEQIRNSNAYIHCTTENTSQTRKSVGITRQQRNEAFAYFMGQEISPLVPNFSGPRIKIMAHYAISNMSQDATHFSTNGMREDDVNRVVDNLLELINLDPLNGSWQRIFKKMGTDHSIFMEMILMMGVFLILRWALEMEQKNHTDARTFLEVVGGENIADEIRKSLEGLQAWDAPRDRNIRMLEWRKYISSVIHCTQTQTENFLQPGTLVTYYPMIKKDACDFMYTFLGDYRLESGIKFIQTTPEYASNEYWREPERAATLRGLPENFVSTLSFYGRTNHIPLMIKSRGTSVPAKKFYFRNFTFELLRDIFISEFGDGLKIAGHPGDLYVLLPEGYDIKEKLKTFMESSSREGSLITAFIGEFDRRSKRPKIVQSSLEHFLLELDRATDRLLVLHI